MEQKEFSAILGGKKRIFKYTRRDRERLEDQFGAGLMDLIKSDLLRTDAEGVPTGGGRWKVQVAIVQAGFRHHGKAVTLERVAGWLEAYVAHGGNVFEVFSQCSLAIMSSGVLGFVYEAEDDEDEDDPKEEAEPST